MDVEPTVVSTAPSTQQTLTETHRNRLIAILRRMFHVAGERQAAILRYVFHYQQYNANYSQEDRVLLGCVPPLLCRGEGYFRNNHDQHRRLLETWVRSSMGGFNKVFGLSLKAKERAIIVVQEGFLSVVQSLYEGRKSICSDPTEISETTDFFVIPLQAPGDLSLSWKAMAERVFGSPLKTVNKEFPNLKFIMVLTIGSSQCQLIWGGEWQKSKRGVGVKHVRLDVEFFSAFSKSLADVVGDLGVAPDRLSLCEAATMAPYHLPSELVSITGPIQGDAIDVGTPFEWMVVLGSIRKQSLTHQGSEFFRKAIVRWHDLLLAPHSDVMQFAAPLLCSEVKPWLLQGDELHLWSKGYQNLCEIVMMVLQAYPALASDTDLEQVVLSYLGDLSDVEARVELYPYAMNALYHALSGAVKAGGRVACVMQNYFETLMLTEKLAGENLDVVRSLDEIKTLPKVLVADIHPNNAAREEIFEHAVVDWVVQQLSDHQDHEMTLVFDLTLNWLGDEKVHDAVVRLRPFIIEGRLTLFICQSLAKLVQLGADNFSGGLCISLNRGAPTLAAGDANQNKERFFGLLLQSFGPLLADYIARVKQNSRLVYRCLNECLNLQPKRLFENPPIQSNCVTSRGSEVEVDVDGIARLRADEQDQFKDALNSYLNESSSRYDFRFQVLDPSSDHVLCFQQMTKERSKSLEYHCTRFVLWFSAYRRGHPQCSIAEFRGILEQLARVVSGQESETSFEVPIYIIDRQTNRIQPDGTVSLNYNGRAVHVLRDGRLRTVAIKGMKVTFASARFVPELPIQFSERFADEFVFGLLCGKKCAVLEADDTLTLQTSAVSELAMRHGRVVGLTQHTDQGAAYIAVNFDNLWQRFGWTKEQVAYGSRGLNAQDVERARERIARRLKELFLDWAALRGLRITGRQSFGFALSNLTHTADCWRFSVGIEDAGELKKYVHLFNAFVTVLTQSVASGISRDFGDSDGYDIPEALMPEEADRIVEGFRRHVQRVLGGVYQGGDLQGARPISFSGSPGLSLAGEVTLGLSRGDLIVNGTAGGEVLDFTQPLVDGFVEPSQGTWCLGLPSTEYSVDHQLTKLEAEELLLSVELQSTGRVALQTHTVRCPLSFWKPVQRIQAIPLSEPSPQDKFPSIFYRLALDSSSIMESQTMRLEIDWISFSLRIHVGERDFLMSQIQVEHLQHNGRFNDLNVGSRLKVIARLLTSQIKFDISSSGVLQLVLGELISEEEWVSTMEANGAAGTRTMEDLCGALLMIKDLYFVPGIENELDELGLHMLGALARAESAIRNRVAKTNAFPLLLQWMHRSWIRHYGLGNHSHSALAQFLAEGWNIQDPFSKIYAATMNTGLTPRGGFSFHIGTVGDFYPLLVLASVATLDESTRNAITQVVATDLHRFVDELFSGDLLYRWCQLLTYGLSPSRPDYPWFGRPYQFLSDCGFDVAALVATGGSSFQMIQSASKLLGQSDQRRPYE